MNTSAPQAVTATELFSALFVSGMYDHDMDTVLAKCDSGHAELMCELVSYAAPLADMMTAAILCVGTDVAGGLLYEVAKPFGSWFGDVVLRAGSMPQRERAVGKLQDLVIDFYSQAENCDPAKLAAAVSGAHGLHVIH